ncbi:MAG: endonuclease domain-containing protein [Methylovirgula sp.]
MRGLRMHEVKRGRELRRAETSAEAKLWARLRARRLNGFKFVRQAPIGPYFADVLCREEKLIVEVDGATHGTSDEIAADARRSDFLADAGFRVLRVTNAEVFDSIESVLETILAALKRRGTW